MSVELTIIHSQLFTVSTIGHPGIPKTFGISGIQELLAEILPNSPGSRISSLRSRLAGRDRLSSGMTLKFLKWSKLECRMDRINAQNYPI